MFQKNIMRFVLIGAASAVLLSLSIAWSAPKASRTDDARKYLEERRTVLEQVVKLQREVVAQGGAKADSVLLAQRDLSEAELDLAERPSERIDIYERLVKTMRDVEEFSHQLYNVGQATQADVLKAKAARLKAQADLSRERTKDED